MSKIDHVVEQRVSNLAQGILTLGTMSGPLLIVLHLIPQGVLAGLFFVMGIQALEGNGITVKLLFLCRDKTLTSASEPLKRIRRRAVWIFVAIQLFGFGATFAVTQTVAAVGFPIIILALIPVRTWVLPRYFSGEELGILDAPTASPFTMVSVGGNHGEDGEEEESGETTEVPSGTGSTVEDLFRGGQGVAPGRREEAAERGEAAGAGGLGMKRRGSRMSEGRSGKLGDSIEMQPPRLAMSNRGGGRQQR